jgi:hypothetical protein
MIIPLSSGWSVKLWIERVRRAANQRKLTSRTYQGDFVMRASLFQVFRGVVVAVEPITTARRLFVAGPMKDPTTVRRSVYASGSAPSIDRPAGAFDQSRFAHFESGKIQLNQSAPARVSRSARLENRSPPPQLKVKV